MQELAAEFSVPVKDPIAVRLRCDGCLRPQSICICDALPADAPLTTETRIVLFIHPKEVRRALGTAPLLRLCLQDVVFQEGERFPEPEEDPNFHDILHEGGRECMLICPGPDAEVLQPLPEGKVESVERRPKTLIFVDGRWPQAKSMVNRSPWLKQLPRALIVPSNQSGYRFRKQPEQGCLSTLEAVAEALLALEGSRGHILKAALLAPFELMVKHQCSFIPEHQAKDKNKIPEELPLFDAEAVAGADADAPDKIYCVVRWGAKSLDGREIVVVKHIRDDHEWAKKLSMQLSAGQSRGCRFWVLPISKVPSNARFEELDCS